MRIDQKPGRIAVPSKIRSVFLSSGFLLASLIGTAKAQTVSLSATVLKFGNEVTGSISVTKKVTLTNTGSATLSITSISASASFVETNTCRSSVSAGAKCTISVTFTPTATGSNSGTVTITDNASNNPQTIATSGTGVNAVTLSTTKLTFPSRTVGTTSGPLLVTLSNNLTTALTFASISATGDFAETNTCGTSVAAGQKCTISTTFTPTLVGARIGTLTVTDSGNNSPQTVALSGIGTTAGLLSIAVTPANPSVIAGSSEQFHATGTFSGGSTYDLTQSVAWSSTAATIATISNVAGTQGLATTLAAGTSIIRAASGKISGSTLLTVSPSLVSITVTPAVSSIALGTGQQFTATGNYSDGSTQNLTNTAVWSSSATNVAMINNAGLASSGATGTTTISATVGSVNGSAVLTVNPATLLSIAVTPAQASAPLGTTEQYEAVGTYSDGSTLDLTTIATWSSGATTVATISNTLGSQGLASTEAVGTANIVATLGSVSGSTGLTVTPAALTAIIVTPALPSIPLGMTQQFTATGTFTDGSTQDLTGTVGWSSSAPGVATISNTAGTQGLATSIAPGSATMTAASGTVTASTSLTVTVAALVSIAVTPANVLIASGSTQQFTATGTFTDGTSQDLTNSATWLSSDTGVVTISNTGLATTVADGSAAISAISGTISGSTTLIVNDAILVAIAVNPPTASISAGASQQFTAIGTFSDSSTTDITGTAYWSTSDGTVATVSDSTGSQGLATGVAAGSITVTATSGSVSGTAGLTVTSATLASISVAPQNPSIALGASEQFTATGTYTDGTSDDITAMVNWTSSIPSTAVISNANGSIGLATSAGAGSTTITATFGGVSGSTTLTVAGATLISIAINPSSATIYVSGAQQFTATGTYSDGSLMDVTSQTAWMSSVPGVATIRSAGLATGVTLGTSTITGTLGSVSSRSSLTVSPAPLVSITINPANPSLKTLALQQMTATGTYSDGSTQDLTSSALWSSSASGVATISNTGLVTAVDPGTSTITAALGSISGTTSLTATAVTLPLGTATLVGSTSCPTGGTTGEICTTVSVSCAGLPDIRATLGVAKPTGTPIGTMILHAGGSGNQFLNEGFPPAYVAGGFNLVQIAWASDWASANGVGVKSAACRPATLFQYIFTTVHLSSRSAGFCGQGSSGGGAALTYSLADYAMGDYFDYVVIAAGPGLSRMDYGCDGTLYRGPNLNLCPLLTNAPYIYTTRSAQQFNTWENTTTCESANPSQSDISRWAADSIVTAGANFAYPKTSMSWFTCATPPVNESSGQGEFLIEQIVPKNSPPDVNCYSGVCKGEVVWTDPNAFNDTLSEVLANCVPNHQ